MNKVKKNLLNILTGFGGKFIVIALSLVVPRLILKSYGSEVNGYFTTLSNFYTYLALIEAGIGASSLQMLYKPVVHNNREEISNIVYTTKRQFRKFGIFYGIGVLLISLILPFALTSNIGKFAMFAIAALQGASSLLNFIILGGITNLLTAEGKNYVKDIIALSVSILTSVAKIVLVNLEVDIVLLQLSYFVLSLIPILVYSVYFHKKYKWLNETKERKIVKLPQTKSFFIHQLSTLVFNHTDMIVITFFLGLKVASVYSIYLLIFSNLYTLVTALFNNISYGLGQKYNSNKDKSEYVKYHDGYKACFCTCIFAVFTVAVILTTPFIKIYTRGIDDITYVDNYLPILFALVNLLSACRSTESNLINIAFHAKQTVWRSVLESSINIVVSLILINFIGVYGCLLGTIIALLYRTNDIVMYSNIKILNRKPFRAYLIILTNFILFIALYFLFKFIPLSIDGYGEFVLWGFVLSISIGALFVISNFLINRKNILYLFKNISKPLRHTK